MADVKKYVSLDKLTKYDAKIKGVIEAGDAATLKSAKDYADGLAKNYDAAGSAATAKSEAIDAAKSYTDTEVAKANAAAAEADRKAVAAQGAAETAQAAADAAQGEVDALEVLVGTLPEGATATNIVGYVQEKTAGIATEGAMTELAGRVTTVEGKVATIEGDYLKATDKKSLEDAIALKADQTALDGVSAVANAAVKQSDYDTKVAALEDEDERIVGLVEAEATKAREEEGKLDARLDKVEAFFEGAAEDGEGLQNALDTLVEIQTYVDTHGEAAAKMVEDIAANKKAIEDHAALDHDFAAADAALKSELNTEIAKKATQADLETLAGRVTVNEGAIADNAEAIAELEALFGEGDGTVAEMIADAVAAEAAEREAGDQAAEASAAEALAAAQAADGKAVAAQGEIDTLEGVVETLSGVVDTKAAAADLTALTTRVTTAEGEIDTLQSEMDAVEALAAANKAAHEANAAAIALKAAQADLEAEVTRATNRENAIEAKVDAFVEVSEEEINALFPTV